MTYVQLLGATVENFGPFEREEYPLTGLGLALVEGRNLDDPAESPHNGVGKSKLYLEGPTWCDFGAIPEGTDADGVVNDLTGKNCAVTTRHEVEGVGPVTVQRYRKVGGRGGLRLWVGRAVRDLADSRDESHRPYELTESDQDRTQERINDLLGLDLEIWRAAVYRAQDDDRRFAALKDSEQKALLTRVFQLDVIDGWRENADRRAKELAAEISTARATIANIEAEGAAAHVAQLEAACASWTSDRASRLAALDADLERLQAAWKDAIARHQRWCAVGDELLRLRYNPPSIGQLEATPPQPADPPIPALAIEPIAPSPRPPQYVAVGPYPAPSTVPAPNTENQEASALAFERNGSALEERARAGIEHARELRRRAQIVGSRRSGTCPECGSPLTPEHADREASKMMAEAARVEGETNTSARLADDAIEAARKTRLEIDGVWRAHTDAVRAAESAHQAAIARWQADDRAARARADEAAAHASAEDRAAWSTAHGAWSAERERLRGIWAAERQRRVLEWQATCEQVLTRNAVKTSSIQGSWREAIARLEAEQAALQDATSRRREVEAEGQAKRAERDRVAAASWDLAQSLEAWRARAVQSTQAHAGLTAQIARAENDLRLAEFWCEGFGPKGLKSFVLDERLQELTDLSNGWLRVLTGGLFWVRFETQAEKKKGGLKEQFTVRIFRHGRTGRIVDRKWGQWSGGQKARVGIAIDLAIADAIAARARRRYNILVFDEVFRHLDTGGRDAMLRALAHLRQTRESIVVVDHDREFKAAFDRRLTVQMEHERARLLLPEVS